MEEQVTRLVDKVWANLLQTPREERILIAIGGIPGSGKTTLCHHLVSAINTRWLSSPQKTQDTPVPVAIAVPMDGFHLTRAQLSVLPDATRAHARRGAEFTFDGLGFLALVRLVRSPLASTSTTIPAPSFDHAIKDPVAAAISIHPHHRVVVFEGLYVVLAREPWSSAAALMDERWFVTCPRHMAKRRLVLRHVAAGIEADVEAAEQRAEENDLVNGDELMRLRLPVHEDIVSTEDGQWAHG